MTLLVRRRCRCNEGLWRVMRVSFAMWQQESAVQQRPAGSLLIYVNTLVYLPREIKLMSKDRRDSGNTLCKHDVD
jgi:hypothetical protein